MKKIVPQSDRSSESQFGRPGSERGQGLSRLKEQAGSRKTPISQSRPELVPSK